MTMRCERARESWNHGSSSLVLCSTDTRRKTRKERVMPLSRGRQQRTSNVPGRHDASVSRRTGAFPIKKTTLISSSLPLAKTCQIRTKAMIHSRLGRTARTSLMTRRRRFQSNMRRRLHIGLLLLRPSQARLRVSLQFIHPLMITCDF